MSTDRPIILGSRSPRRFELLSHLLPESRIQVLAPSDTTEAGFAGLKTLEQIRERLTAIARTKNDAVRNLLTRPGWGGILTADTVVIADNSQSPIVLEKPDGPDWERKTRHWFQHYYSGRSHQVATAVCLRTAGEQIVEQLIHTNVHFCEVTSEMLDWYLSTREPLGKAGGYGLQGAAALFVTAVHGSPSNVVGLPLLETRQLLQTCQLL